MKPASEPNLKAAATQFTVPPAVKGGKFESTYARLFKKFTKDIHRLSDNMTNDRQKFAAMVIMDVVSTHTANDIRRPATDIRELSQDIQANLDRWKAGTTSGRRSSSNDFVSTSYQSNEQTYAVYKKEVDDRELQRTKLKDESNKYIEYMYGRFEEVKNAIAEKKSDAEIEAIFADIEKRHKDLKEKVGKLERNEDSLERNLRDLRQKTDATLNTLVSTGAIPPLAAPQKK